MMPEQNSNNKLILMYFFVGAICFVLGFGYAYSIKGLTQTKNQNNYVSQSEYPTQLEEFGMYQKVLEIIDDEYLEENIDDQKLVYGSIDGLVESLGDRYSDFLDPEENKANQEQNAGRYKGIGVYLNYNKEYGYTYVETPMDGYPAQKNGVMAGDLIVAIDEKDMRGKREFEVRSLVIGEEGTKVKIRFFRPKTNETIEKELERAQIDIDNITYEDLGNGIFKIKVSQFTESTSAEFISKWNQTVDEIVAKKPKAIILDLRNNPGGYVNAALHVLDEFLGQDMVLMSEVGRDIEKVSYKATSGGKFENIKLVVLVNSGSASASEIVTGALQDHGRAKIIGTKTVGKGVEQKIIPLENGAALHLVFKKWLTPNGHNVSAENPISPDIEVEYTQEDFDAKRDPQQDKAKEILAQ